MTDSRVMPNLHVLHVEDNLLDAELIAGVLAEEWPGCTINRVQTRQDFLRALEIMRFDLILSDFSLPQFDGMSALALTRERDTATPFIFLSGTIGEDNAILALRRGATDYVIKDRPGRLVPAVRRALEEVQANRQRQDAEEKLRESQERFQQFAEQSGDIFWFVALDPERILYIGPAIEQIWGQAADKFYRDPRAWLEAVHTEDRARVRQAYVDCITGKAQRYEEEFRVVRPDGSIRWVLDSATIIRDAKGKVIRLSGIAKDISVRKAGEQQLREQARWLDEATDAICVTDLEGRLTYWNRSTAELGGWQGTEPRGRLLTDLFLLLGSTTLHEAMQQVHAQGTWRGEIQLAGGDRTLRQFESHWTLVRDPAGRARSILLINTDITAKRQLETQLRRSQRIESIGMLAGGIAHDLNNMLAPILMAVELIEANAKDPEITRLANMAAANAQKGGALVRQVLAFARGAEGKKQTLQLPPVIGEVADLLNETFPRSIKIEVDVPAELSAVFSDATQFNQVLVNLCVNARDAMPAGGTLKITAANCELDVSGAHRHPEAKPGRYVNVSVSDTGTGIPPGVIDRIFDPFFTTKAIGKGTGLGLSVVLGIVKNHGGFLEVDSKEGQGTTIRLFLPASAKASTTPPVSVSQAMPLGNGQKILVIDDEEAVRTMLAILLGKLGYITLFANDGIMGLKVYQENARVVSLVLSDMMMPGLPVTELVAGLRRIRSDTDIVLMSGLVGPEVDQTLRTLGCKGFMRKPMTAGEVATTIARALSAHAIASPSWIR